MVVKEDSEEARSLEEHPEAFERFFRHYAPRLRAFFVRRGAGPPVCDELTQEVMFSAWRKREQFDPARGALPTWIFTIARNRLLDHVRRLRPEPDPQDPLWSAERPECLAPDETADARRDRDRLREAIAALPDELRGLLLGLYYEGKTMNELSLETGIPLGTVKTRARRALLFLRTALMGNTT